MNRTIALVSLIVSVLSLPVLGQSVFDDVRQSHIEANVPAPADFSNLMKRDLLGYFQGGSSKEATAVEYHLLRDGPTQSGVAYPKYYAWVRVYRGPVLVAEGAARMAAIERLRFEVTDFLSKANIEDNPRFVGAVFPAPLVPRILEFAGRQ